jgi:hypothetical protein
MRYIPIFLLAIIAFSVQAQSKTTEALHKKHSEALSLFFYNNTLRMVNQIDDKEFDELIKDIEKMKFLMIKKEDFVKNDYKKLISDYKAEAFEEMMTSRHDGKNFDIYIKEGKTKGMIVTVNDSTNLYVLDIVGSIPLNKVTKLFSTIDESSEIGKRIKSFASKDDN